MKSDDQQAPVSALREDIQGELDRLGTADVILGIPAYNNEDTVGDVVERLARGIREVYPDKKAVLMVADGGSLDDTREAARRAEVPDEVERFVTIYRGLAGKGTALRAVFEAGTDLDVEAGMLVDSDMRQWPAEWTRRHLKPVFEESMDLMTPLYERHKYDATITNSVCFPLTTVLYGQRIRQPIGGDFALSGDLMKFYARQDEWGTDVARFGIDIWMTTSALCEGFDVGQTRLGAKIHDPKDPGESLGPMFRQVVGTLFRVAGRYRDDWWDTDGYEDAPIFGSPLDAEPEPVPVNRPNLRSNAVEGWEQHRDLIQQCLSDSTYEVVRQVMEDLEESDSILSFLTPKTWIRILCDYLVTYNFSGLERDSIMNSLVPLYFARTWTLYHEMDPMVGSESERYLRELVDSFAREKDYLRNRWRNAKP